MFKGTPTLKLLCWLALCIALKEAHQFGFSLYLVAVSKSQDLHRLEWNIVTKYRVVIKMPVLLDKWCTQFHPLVHLISFLCPSKSKLPCHVMHLTNHLLSFGLNGKSVVSLKFDQVIFVFLLFPSTSLNKGKFILY